MAGKKRASMEDLFYYCPNDTLCAWRNCEWTDVPVVLSAPEFDIARVDDPQLFLFVTDERFYAFEKLQERVTKKKTWEKLVSRTKSYTSSLMWLSEKHLVMKSNPLEVITIEHKIWSYIQCLNKAKQILNYCLTPTIWMFIWKFVNLELDFW